MSSLQFEINLYPGGKDSSPAEIHKMMPCWLGQGEPQLRSNGYGCAHREWGGFGAPSDQADFGLLAVFAAPGLFSMLPPFLSLRL